MKRILILIAACLLINNFAKSQTDSLGNEIDKLIVFVNHCKDEIASKELSNTTGTVKFDTLTESNMKPYIDYFKSDTFNYQEIKIQRKRVRIAVENLETAFQKLITDLESLKASKDQNWVYYNDIKTNLERLIIFALSISNSASIYYIHQLLKENLDTTNQKLTTTDQQIITEQTNLILMDDSLDHVKIDYDTFKIKQTDKINPDFDKRISNLEGREDLEMLTLSFNYPLTYSLSGLNKADMSYSYKSNYFFSLNYSHFKNGSWFGIGMEGGFNKVTLNLTAAHTIFDSIPNQIDIDGDPYTMYVYGDNIQETATITSLYIMPQVCIKFLNKSKWLMTFNPGIKFTTVLSSSYSGTNGTVSYGGYYPQYNSKDTLFNGLYDYYQNAPVYNQSQHLILRNEMVDVVLPVNVSYFINKHWGITLGAYYDFGLTNILNNEPQQQVISYGLNSYNSLLYREESIKTNSLGIKLGVSFKF